MSIGGSRKANMSGVMNKLKDEASADSEVKKNVVEATQPKEQKFGDLKNLVLFGKMTEDVVIGDYTFSITTLKAKKQKQLVSRMMKLSEEDKLLNIKLYTLAEAIESINYVNFEEIEFDYESTDVFDRKVEILLEFQSSIINKLYDNYEKLSDSSRRAISGVQDIKK